jgi:hypothetical protein
MGPRRRIPDRAARDRTLEPVDFAHGAKGTGPSPKERVAEFVGGGQGIDSFLRTAAAASPGSEDGFGDTRPKATASVPAPVAALQPVWRMWNWVR